MQPEDHLPTYAQSVEQPTPIILTLHLLTHIHPGPPAKLGRHISTLHEAVLISPSTTYVDFVTEQVNHAAKLFNCSRDTTVGWGLMLRGKKGRVVGEGNWEAVKKVSIASKERGGRKLELVLILGPAREEKKGLIRRVMEKLRGSSTG